MNKKTFFRSLLLIVLLVPNFTLLNGALIAERGGGERGGMDRGPNEQFNRNRVEERGFVRGVDRGQNMEGANQAAYPQAYPVQVNPTYNVGPTQVNPAPSPNQNR